MVQGTFLQMLLLLVLTRTTPTVYRSYSRNVVAGQPWGLSPYQDMMMSALFSGPAADGILADNN
jgi:hypothetical protein